MCIRDSAKTVWHYFLKATKSKSKAGAFVSWWKNGRLTKDSVHAVIIERLRETTKKLPDNIKGLRKVAKTMTHAEYLAYIEKYKVTQQETVTNEQTTSFEQSIENLVRPTGNIRTKRAFDYNQFKVDYKEEYERIRKERTNAFNSFKDIPNYEAQLENSIKGYCEQWFRKAYK